VHSYAEHGEGLLIVAEQQAIPEKRPDGGAMVIASTYDLGAHQLDAVRSHWDGWKAENYPTEVPAH